MRILIIEDSKSSAMLLTEWLRPLARSITVAPDMESAIKELNGVNPFDIITLDLSLTDSTSIETLQRVVEIKQLNPNCLLVVITGMAVQSNTAAEYGADGFLDKSETFKLGKQTFLDNLLNIGRSIARVPSKYQKNIDFLEEITNKIAKHCAATPPLPKNES